MAQLWDSIKTEVRASVTKATADAIKARLTQADSFETKNVELEAEIKTVKDSHKELLKEVKKSENQQARLEELIQSVRQELKEKERVIERFKRKQEAAQAKQDFQYGLKNKRMLLGPRVL
jgi:chromosome segregation ATPase